MRRVYGVSLVMGPNEARHSMRWPLLSSCRLSVKAHLCGFFKGAELYEALLRRMLPISHAYALLWFLYFAILRLQA